MVGLVTVAIGYRFLLLLLLQTYDGTVSSSFSVSVSASDIAWPWDWVDSGLSDYGLCSSMLGFVVCPVMFLGLKKVEHKLHSEMSVWDMVDRPDGVLYMAPSLGMAHDHTTRFCASWITFISCTKLSPNNHFVTFTVGLRRAKRVIFWVHIRFRRLFSLTYKFKVWTSQRCQSTLHFKTQVFWLQTHCLSQSSYASDQRLLHLLHFDIPYERALWRWIVQNLWVRIGHNQVHTQFSGQGKDS